MHTKIKDGYNNLAIEREKLTKVQREKGDIGTERLKSWPLFNAACVIAESYQSDVRKKLKLEIAVGHLNDAKSEMSQYGIRSDNFLTIEKSLKLIIDTIGELVVATYKVKMSALREDEIGYEAIPVNPSRSS